jgi:hypothetical protein
MNGFCGGLTQDGRFITVVYDMIPHTLVCIRSEALTYFVFLYFRCAAWRREFGLEERARESLRGKEGYIYIYKHADERWELKSPRYDDNFIHLGYIRDE